MDKLSFLTFGAGAIGTYFGGSLALAGHKVVFLEQPTSAVELNDRGMKLDLSLDERWQSSQPIGLPPSSFFCASSLREALDQGPFDVAIFALKSFDTEAALEGIKPFVDQMPPVLCLQNGVENEDKLKKVLGKDKVLTGTTTASVGRLGVGNIVLERLRGVGIATDCDSSLLPLTDKLFRAMDEAYLNPVLFEKGLDMKWSKMLTNLLGNATAAILNMTPAEVFQNKKLFALEMGMIREALKVMDALGIHPVKLPKVPVSLLIFAVRYLPGFLVRPILVKMVGSGRGGKMPSFHIDLHAGRKKIEVDYLNGAVVRAGQRVGIKTPINQLLNTTLQDLVDGKQSIADYSHQPEKLLAML
jgi:2-dehydropantoate 2-reductase